MASHTTSHMDALVHVYGEYKHYNGVGHDEMHALGGAQRLGIEKVGGFAARAVLLDMVAYFGDDTHVTLGRNITSDDLRGAAAAQGVEVRAGDVVLIRTGYLQFWWENNASGNPPPFEQAGIGGDAARWLASQDIAANVARQSQAIHDGLEAMDRDLGLFAQVRGRGLMLGAVLKPEHAGKASAIGDLAAAHGLLLLQAGPNVLRFVPALNIGDEDIADGLARLRKALEAFVGG